MLALIVVVARCDHSLSCLQLPLSRLTCLGRLARLTQFARLAQLAHIGRSVQLALLVQLALSRLSSPSWFSWLWLSRLTPSSLLLGQLLVSSDSPFCVAESG